MEIIATTPLELIVVAAGAGLFLVLTLLRPRDAVVVVILLTPLYLIRIREGALRTNALDLLVMGALAGFFALWLRKKIELSLPWWIAPASLIILGAAFATITAGFWLQLRALGELKSIFILPVLFGVAAYAFVQQDVRNKKLFLAAVVVGAALQASGALIGALFGGDFVTYDMRLRGFFLSPNHLAMVLAPALAVALGLFLFETTKKIRFGFGIAFGVIAIALLFTQSSGGIISAALGALTLLLLTRKIPLKAVFAALFLVVVATTAAFIVFDTGARSSFASRIMVWQAALEILKDHWFFGIGPGAFQYYFLSVQPQFPPYLEWAVPQPHNIFLAIWLSAGLLGLSGFLWLLFVITKKALLALRHSSSIPYSLFPIPFAALAAIILHGLIDTPILKNDLAVLFVVVLATIP
ncbi:MAG: hypothetical protein A2806_01165 [Candidatus Terrybacteria bacterium RIFCSPHIGHO2_01_FULL_48_17]|uniref:O-antigen ligase-related domain-containing protein n=1 Tax=Candidatus Terrybacteria bacterium RIFCSPHIGHO2_01_FULL_48_17 TaxID=1802362 RepID=A0A1G2PK69_9BACT|nr:MAG: hypothetical protein A2806_01165 [Candidatus Terrybacteria bacterium RIFCSPHIGHO2_01_FULL_48_17]OHA53419.1 MAG: hypothetical protein A3A30_02790 [Candidatus Terrybacteria bacterium RIFCSPLOWO2_01_FULL_48_14]